MNLINWLLPSERQAVINGIRFSIGYSQEDAQTRYRVDLLSIPAISQAIELKSNDVGQIPMGLYLRTSAGRVRQRGRLDSLLSERPNRFTNAYTFWKTVAMQATMGECFVSTRGGELNVLPYGSCIRYVTSAGEVRYASTYTKTELQQLGYSNPASVVIKDDYTFNEVLHFWTFQDEYGIPIPMRTRFRHVLGLGSDIYAYTCNVYNRGGVITGYLSTDKQIDDAKKVSIIQGFKALFFRSRTKETGNDNLMAALDNGWKFNRLDLTPQEMQLLATKEDLQRDFSQIVGVPLWKLGVTKDVHYATAEAAQREYLQSSLNPLLVQIEREVNTKLIAPYESEYLYAEFTRDALIAIDAKTQAEIDDIDIKNGSLSADERRERRNLPHNGNDVKQVPVNVTSSDYLVANEALKLESARLDIALKQAQLAAMGKPALTLTLPPMTPAPTPGSASIDLDAGDGASVDLTPAEAAAAQEVAAQSAIADAGAGGPTDALGSNVNPQAAGGVTIKTPAGCPTPADGVADETANVALQTPIDYIASLKAMQAKYSEDVTPEQLRNADVVGVTVRAVCGEVAGLHGLTADHLAAFAEKYTNAANNRLAGAEPADVGYEMNRLVNAANYESLRLCHGVKTQVRWVGGAFDGQVRAITDPFQGGLRHPPVNAGEHDCYLVKHES